MTTNRGNSLTAEGPALVLARTGADAWQDLDWDQQFDPGERTGPYPMLAVVEAGQGRVVAVADNTFPDHAFAWRSNDLLMRSLLQWVTHATLFYGQYQIYVPLVEYSKEKTKSTRTFNLALSVRYAASWLVTPRRGIVSSPPTQGL